MIYYLHMKIRHYNVLFYSEPEGGFTATVPSLPGCVTYGENLKEAKKMVRDAIEGYIASLKKHNEPIPSDDDVVTSFIDIEEPIQSSYAKTSRSYAS